MQKKIFLSIGILLGFSLLFTFIAMNGGNQDSAPSTSIAAVPKEGETQHIRILARGGYTPKKIQAKANVPTVLEFETKGTYDCSSSVSIPALGYQNSLPSTGITQVQIPNYQAVGTMKILCSMGMYHSTINFEL